jgi:hypothetical protein
MTDAQAPINPLDLWVKLDKWIRKNIFTMLGIILIMGIVLYDMATVIHNNIP